MEKSNIVERTYYTTVFADPRGYHSLSIPRLDDTEESLCLRIFDTDDEEFELWVGDQMVGRSKNSVFHLADIRLWAEPFMEKFLYGITVKNPDLGRIQQERRGYDLEHVGGLKLLYSNQFSSHQIRLDMVEKVSIKKERSME